MATPRARWIIPALVLVAGAAACGDDDEAAVTTEVITSIGAPATLPGTSAPDGAATTAPATTAAPASSAPATTTAAGAPRTAPATTVAAPALTVDDGAVAIEVTVGVDDGPDRIEPVPLGAVVTIGITNPAADDEFHLHDYDLGGGSEVPAGQRASFTFTADRAGTFELESHVTDDVLLVLQVG